MVERYGNIILFRPPFESFDRLGVDRCLSLRCSSGVFVAVRIVRRRAALVGSDASVVEREDIAR